MSKNSEDSVIKLYKTQAMLAQAQEMFLKKTIELEEKNSEVKAKNKEIETLQEAMTAQKKEFEEANKIIKKLEEENSRLKAEVKLLHKKTTDKTKVHMDPVAKKIIGDMKVGIDKLIVQLCHLETGSYGEMDEKSLETESVLLLGNDRGCLSVYIYVTSMDCFRRLPLKLPPMLINFGAAAIRTDFFVFGGFSASGGSLEYVNHCYKLINKQGMVAWQRLADMNDNRGHIAKSTIVINSEVWIFGGFNNHAGKRELKSVEKYNPFSDTWTKLPDMNHERANAAATEFKGKIYVSGGYLYTSATRVQSVEVFDPELQKWSVLCDLPSILGGLYDHGFVSYADGLVLLGGYGGDGCSNKMWKLNPEEKEKIWQEMPNFIIPRSSFGILQVKGSITIMGGYFGNNEVRATEIFNGTRWIQGATLPETVPRIASIPLTKPLEEKIIKLLF